MGLGRLARFRQTHGQGLAGFGGLVCHLVGFRHVSRRRFHRRGMRRRVGFGGDRSPGQLDSPDDPDRAIVTFQRRPGWHVLVRARRLAKERLAPEGSLLGDRDEAQRVEPVFFGKCLGFGQRQFRHHGNLRQFALGPPVEDQIRDRIGGPSRQGLGDLVATCGVIGAGGADGGVEDLRVGQYQLRRHAPRRQRRSRTAQEPKRFRQLRIFQIGIADQHPASRGAVQKADSVMREGQCKSWLHSGQLSQMQPAPKRCSGPRPVLEQNLAQGKRDPQGTACGVRHMDEM